MDLSGLIDFTNRFATSVALFTDAIFDFMTFEIAVFDNITIFELLFGAGISIYLTAAITKWFIDVVS